MRTPEELRQLHGPLRIQKACALGERVVVVGLRGVLKDGLHQVRRQKGVRLQHQRDRPADHGRGHARAGQRQVRLVRRRQSPVEQIGGAGRVEEARRIAERHDAAAGRDNVRLGLEVDRRGAARAVGRNDVIGAGHGAVAVGSADREHPGCVAGCGYAAVLRLAVGRLPEVAGSGDNDNPGVHRVLGGKRQGIGEEGLRDGRADREIDDPDVVGRAIRYRPFSAAMTPLTVPWP